MEFASTHGSGPVVPEPSTAVVTGSIVVGSPPVVGSGPEVVPVRSGSDVAGSTVVTGGPEDDEPLSPDADDSMSPTVGGDSKHPPSTTTHTIARHELLHTIRSYTVLRPSEGGRVWGSMQDVALKTDAILKFWFGSMDDRTLLDSSVEPFASLYARWYGKQPEIDRQIRERFEGELLAVTSSGAAWEEALDAWAAHRGGLLALTILVDQFPRNMYRGRSQMYAHDPLALLVSERARKAPEASALPLPYQLFGLVPLMHVESVPLQHHMVSQFERLFALAQERSPANIGFYARVLDSAHRHADVVERFGRFPHRNAILGRNSTLEEASFLDHEDAYF